MTDFSWSFEPKFEEEKPAKLAPRKIKRRWQEEISAPQQKHIPRKPFKASKRPRNSSVVMGSQLPISRLIELLDKKQLTNLVLKLIDEKPELSQIVHRNLDGKFDLLINPSIDKLMRFLAEQLEMVLQKLPYKVDPELEYLFLRVQKQLVEFYGALSDFIRNYLPPREKSFVVCLRFIDFATLLVHKIPHFQINSYNLYHYTKIYHELADAWWSIFKGFFADAGSRGESDINVFRMVEYGLLEKVENHQKLCGCDEFDKIVDFVKSKIDEYHLSNVDLGTSLVSDLMLEGCKSKYEGSVREELGIYH